MCLYPIEIKDKVSGLYQKVKCGKCLECMKSSSTEWALRIMLEAKQHSENCCITLTYDNEHVPLDMNLRRSDIQLFVKSLRKELSPVKIRVFYSGEYGEKTGRPHYHLIVFGWFPDDAYFKFYNRGNEYFNSQTVIKLWKRGHCPIGKLTYDTAFYCAKYLQKAVGQKKEVAPFIGMSNRPGIGFGAIKPEMLKQCCFYYDGKKVPLPRYFQKVLERDGDRSDIVHLRSSRRKALEQSLRCNTDESLEHRRKRERDFLGFESWEISRKKDNKNA